MKTNQLTKGNDRRVMYIEPRDNGSGLGGARIGWVRFSKSGKSVYYRGLRLERIAGGGIRGNYFDVETGSEYWVSGVKAKGDNRHPSEAKVDVTIDEDALEEYHAIRGQIA
ncbi:MAG: hypothetical protein AAGM16_12985 [Pseudomonadota bacterium]